MNEPLSRTELAEKYSDSDWRRRLIDLISLVAILRESIIDAKYRPSKALVDAIKLTRSGSKLKQQLITQEGVHALDAPVLVFLSLVHVDPLVEVDAFDMSAFEQALSDEIRAGDIRFPMVFGRELYDRAVDLFKEERDYLKAKDTNLLLEDTQAGVFQAGHYLVGPFGLMRRSYRRSMQPTTAIPLQHCADPACSVVHRVQLSTSQEAGVNKGRPALAKLLDQISEEPSEWNEFIGDITENDRNPYEIASYLGVPWLLGDCFDDHELHIVASRAFQVTDGAFSNALRELKVSPNPRALEGWSRAELLQALLMLDDADLVRAIEASLVIPDESTNAEAVVVPPGEIRRPMVNRHARYGAWRLRPELSRLGVRVTTAHSTLPILRLEELVRKLHPLDDASHAQDLLWAIGTDTAGEPEAALNAFLRARSPEEILDRLVLSQREAAEAACAEVGVKPLSDRRALRDSLLWKLGFPLPVNNDLRDEYWSHHQHLEAAIKTASVNPAQSADQLRSGSSDYFVSLERYLFDALVYSAWALLNDHYSAELPFAFVSSKAREFALLELNAPGDADASGMNLNAEPVLSAIVSGFSRLSQRLTALRVNSRNSLRSAAQFPKYAARTQLQKFPFEHTSIFLDLTEESQLALIEVLEQVGRELNQSGIMTARNGLLHAKVRVPTVGEVQESLAKARKAIERLEIAGLVRATFGLASVEANAWGRSRSRLRSGDMEILFDSPSAFDWVGLPPLDQPVYLMQGAVFSPPGEILRFAHRAESSYDLYWRGFPKRPEPGNRAVTTENAPAGAPIDAGSFSSSRD